MSSTLELYDLASKGEGGNHCWSFNVWKTRLVLNYKELPYTTKWLNYTNLGPTLRSIGVPENTGGGFPFTVPTMMFATGPVTDSMAIATRLQELYPSPSLHLDAELQAEAEKIIHEIAMPMFAIYMPRAAQRLVPEDALATFKASREKRFGMSLEEMEAIRGGEKAWKAVEPGLASLKSFLANSKTDSGPWIRGSQLHYADFLVVALFEAFRRAGQDLFDRLMAQEDAFLVLYNAAAIYLKRDD